jgi:drug/metabolite transporter (DMT)-like permease
MKLSNIKLLIGLLVFFALYLSYNIPVVKIQKLTQIGSTALALVGMFLVFRHPQEQDKKWLNLTLMVLLAATLVGYAIVK